MVFQTTMIWSFALPLDINMMKSYRQKESTERKATKKTIHGTEDEIPLDIKPGQSK